jgi:hypothetical protein
MQYTQNSDEKSPKANTPTAAGGSVYPDGSTGANFLWYHQIYPYVGLLRAAFLRRRII